MKKVSTKKKSILGYKDNSPYANAKSLKIDTPNGRITMNGVSKDLIGITPEGEVQFMKANSGDYQFKSNQVLEIPANGLLEKFFSGGTINGMLPEEYMKQVETGKTGNALNTGSTVLKGIEQMAPLADMIVPGLGSAIGAGSQLLQGGIDLIQGGRRQKALVGAQIANQQNQFANQQQANSQMLYGKKGLKTRKGQYGMKMNPYIQESNPVIPKTGPTEFTNTSNMFKSFLPQEGQALLSGIQALVEGFNGQKQKDQLYSGLVADKKLDQYSSMIQKNNAKSFMGARKGGKITRKKC